MGCQLRRRLLRRAVAATYWERSRSCQAGATMVEVGWPLAVSVPAVERLGARTAVSVTSASSCPLTKRAMPVVPGAMVAHMPTTVIAVEPGLTGDCPCRRALGLLVATGMPS